MSHLLQEDFDNYAYKGTWTEHSPKSGQKCVVKKFKDSYTWEPSGWDNTILMQQRVQEMARNFGYGLEYTNCDQGCCNCNCNCNLIES